MTDQREAVSDTEMAGADFMPQNSNIKPALDSIFAEIEKSLPTIDFEISDVSSEEDIPIFHRPLQTAKESSDDGDEDEDDDESSFFSDGDIISKLEQLKFAGPEMTQLDLKGVSETNTYSTMDESPPETSEHSNSRSFGTSTDSESTTSSTKHYTPPPSPIRDNWVAHEHEAPGSDRISSHCPASKAPEKYDKISEIDESGSGKKVKSSDIKKECKIVEVISRYLPSTPPTLKLDNIDIDEAVSGTLERISDGTTSLSSPFNPAPSTEKEETSLIQKLAQLSVEQSGTSLTEVDPNTGALKKKPGGLKDIKTAHNVSVSSTGPIKSQETRKKIIPSDLINLPTSKLSPSPSLHKKDEPETVYLDLRRFDEKVKEQKQSIERVQRVLGISPKQDDTSSDEEDTQSWIEQRQKIKQSLHETGSLPKELVSKSKSDKTQASQISRPRTQAQKLAPCFRKQSASKETTPKPAPTEVPAPPPDKEKEKAEKLAAARKLHEQKQHERQSRLRLGQCLEAIRPTLSDKGHHKCAEATPTLFDIDASYEPAPQAVPHELTSDIELILLSVHLSSNGKMVAHHGAARKSVDKGAGLSASYTTLITWLLSLVPDNFDFLKSVPTTPVMSRAPFHVLGLQQMVLNGEFRLFVAVAPVEKFTPKDAPGKGRSKMKKRDEIKDSSPFQQILAKYFSGNTLHTVCPWLQDLVSLEVTEGNQSHNPDVFAYKTPLPYITTRPLSTFIQVSPDSLAASKVFQTPIGFFWQTIENEESSLDLNLNEEGLSFDVQNTMSLIYKKVYRNSAAMMGILNQVLQEGLDLAGLRLLYPTPELLNIAARNPGLPQVEQHRDSTALEVLNHIGPIVSLAIRGTYARTIWLDAIGPSDPVLARRTDPNSLCARYGGESRDECLLFCPRNPERIHSELCRWFGGRVPPSGVINVGTTSNEFMVSGKRASKKSSSAQTEMDIVQKQPVATLTATIRSDVILVISPLVPARCIGLVVAICQRRGYQLHGVKRCNISPKRAVNIGISGLPVSVFTNQPVPTKENSEKRGKEVVLSQAPATFLLLNKENAFHTAASLIEAFMVQMSLKGVLGDLAVALEASGCEVEITSSVLFHIIHYSDNILSVIGDLSKIPNSDLNTTPGYITPRLHTNPELEQIVVLTLTGHQLLKTFGLLLGQLLGVVPYHKSKTPAFKHGMELLGIKWLSSLSLQHAKELTPYEVGEPAWKSSLQKLTSEPAVVLALRAVNAFKQLESFLEARLGRTLSQHSLQQPARTLETIMSRTPETAYRQAILFFHKWELYPDPSARVMLKYLPPIRKGSNLSSQRPEDMLYGESILETMLSGPRPITTLLLCKPNVVQRHLPKVLRWLTQEGFSIVGMRLVMLTREEALIAVPPEDREDDILCGMHIDFLTSAPSLVLCLLRENAIKKLIDLVGPYDPKEARLQAAGLWRGVFGTDPVINGLHCSASYDDSIKELKVFFPAGLCCKQTNDLEAEQINCPCEDPIATLSDYRQRDVITGLQQSAEQQPAIKCSGTTSNEHRLPVTSLTQTNCIILTPGLFVTQPRSKKLAFVDVLEHLLNKGFHFVGIRMLWMTEEQAQNFLHINDAGSFTLVPLLKSGPSLVVAVQRDNAVIAFDSLLGSIYEKDSVLVKYGEHILRPKDSTHANRLLCYFFNELIPAAHTKVVTRSSSDDCVGP